MAATTFGSREGSARCATTVAPDAVPERPTERPAMQPTQGGSSGTLSSALFAPALSGLKATVMVQLAPPCTGPLLGEQLPPVTENSAAFAPVMVIGPSTAIPAGAPPTAATWMVCAA